MLAHDILNIALRQIPISKKKMITDSCRNPNVYPQMLRITHKILSN